ncbi:MAG: DEAD/DEAH box helicase [Thermoplasmatota archaeon]
MGAFDLLSESILKVLDELGIEKETKPQEDAIPPILEKKNTLVIAPTGIGKTEAAVLPILHNILKSEKEGFKVLYITPLKALNRDMIQRIKEFADRLDFTVGVRHGDTSQKERRRQSKNPPDFLITTPETLQIMFTGSRLRKGLENVEHVVVDELNELAVDERGSQLSLALERLVELTGRDFQRVGLSATVGSPERVKQFLVGIGRDAEIVEITGQREIEVTVEHPLPEDNDKRISEMMRCEVEKAASVRRCKELIDEHKSTLFFVNTRDAAESLASCFNLWIEDYPIGVHHGSLSKEARIDVEDKFKSGDIKALICTSSMELGIDLGDTDFVLQYQSPRQVTRYVQRVGRSGHKIGKISKGNIITSTRDDIAEAGVIARRSLARDLESTDIPEKPMSVLANQLISTVHSEKKIDFNDFYNLVVRAYPFRKLSKDEYDELIEQLSDIRVIWKEGNEIGKRRASLSYFYENISMIPDEKTFLMKNIASNSIIGTLDESFVASQGEIGGVITLQGKAWRVLDIEDDEVLVNPVKDLGKIPDWTGEDIPVPYEIAREVGNIRRAKIADDKYPILDYTRKIFEDYIKEQNGYPLATDDNIVIDIGKNTVVVNACFGSLVNQTLGRLFASLLSARLGETVGLQTDPYRIMMKLPRRVQPSKIKDILYRNNPDVLKDLLKKSIRNSNFFRWKFLHVAKKFGAVKKEVDYRSINVDRLIDAFEGTPLFEEAVNKTLRDNMDIRKTKMALEKIRSGEIKVVLSEQGISPIGEEGLEKHREFLSPDRVSHAVLMSLKERLESEEVIMKCLKCGTRRRKRVKDVGKPSCPRCGSFMIAPLRPYDDPDVIDKDRDKLTASEKKKLREYYKIADLARVYKKKAVMALSARGVGHKNAARILSRAHEDEDDFLRDILKAEIRYARTKRFWD